MLKDVHLIHVALANDEIVFALDDKARRYFAKLTLHTGEFKSVVWINPDKDAVGLSWLKDPKSNVEHLKLGIFVVE